MVLSLQVFLFGCFVAFITAFCGGNLVARFEISDHGERVSERKGTSGWVVSELANALFLQILRFP